MSYGIGRQSPVAPDAEPVVGHLYKVIPCVVRRWAITQKLNTLEQLNYGIRLILEFVKFDSIWLINQRWF